MRRVEQKVTRTDPRFARRDEVVVEETNIRPWTGTVTAVKFSPVSGWWVEIVRGSDGTYVMPEAVVRAVS